MTTVAKRLLWLNRVTQFLQPHCGGMWIMDTPLDGSGDSDVYIKVARLFKEGASGTLEDKTGKAMEAMPAALGIRKTEQLGVLIYRYVTPDLIRIQIQFRANQIVRAPVTQPPSGTRPEVP